MNRFTGHEDDTSGGMCFLLTLVTCGIYGFFWAYKMGAKLDEHRTAIGGSSRSFPILFLVWGVARNIIPRV